MNWNEPQRLEFFFSSRMDEQIFFGDNLSRSLVSTRLIEGSCFHIDTSYLAQRHLAWYLMWRFYRKHSKRSHFSTAAGTSDGRSMWWLNIQYFLLVLYHKHIFLYNNSILWFIWNGHIRIHIFAKLVQSNSLAIWKFAFIIQSLLHPLPGCHP